MRRWLCVVLALLSLGSVALAGPKLVLDRDLYDFGTAMDGTVIRFEVTLTNAGDAALQISNVSYNCSCTSYHLPKRNLAPGESMQMTITFNTRGYSYHPQPVSQVVTVSSDDPARPQQTIVVRGHVRSLATHEGSASALDQEFYVLVDLRSAEAYARGHLMGAMNIPFDELPTRLNELPKSEVVYLYDETGIQAVQAAQLLQQNAFLLPRAISGGLAGWWLAFGDLFFVWASDAARTPPEGTPYYGAYSVQASRVAQNYLVVVDIRSSQAYAQGHFAGAVNVSLGTQDELSSWVAALPRPKLGTALAMWIVDDDGTRSCAIAQYLQSQGFTKARCLFGGVAAWRAQFGDELLYTSEPPQG